MKTLINLLLMSAFMLLSIILAGCEQTTEPTEYSGNQQLNKAYQSRPFTGDFIYVFSSQINDSVSTYYATGNASHLGYCTVVDTTIHHYTLTGLTVEGSDWITAANGALVHMTWFMDYFDPTTWVWEIVGGTGRFNGASGSGTYTAEITSTGDLAIRFTGELTY
jgi:hypothetical protein